MWNVLWEWLQTSWRALIDALERAVDAPDAANAAILLGLLIFLLPLAVRGFSLASRWVTPQKAPQSEWAVFPAEGRERLIRITRTQASAERLDFDKDRVVVVEAQAGKRWVRTVAKIAPRNERGDFTGLAIEMTRAAIDKLGITTDGENTFSVKLRLRKRVPLSPSRLVDDTLNNPDPSVRLAWWMFYLQIPVGILISYLSSIR